MWSIAIEAFKCQLIGCKTMKTKLIYVEAWRETEPSCISFQNCLSSSFLIYPYTAWMKQLLKFFDLTYIYLCIFIHTAQVKFCVLKKLYFFTKFLLHMFVHCILCVFVLKALKHDIALSMPSLITTLYQRHSCFCIQNNTFQLKLHYSTILRCFCIQNETIVQLSENAILLIGGFDTVELRRNIRPNQHQE